jgi:hypothetical protein
MLVEPLWRAVRDGFRNFLIAASVPASDGVNVGGLRLFP